MLVGAEAMNSESANKFISALVKALQTLCHGYVEFNDGIEIIGHIYLNIDSGSSFDYVVKEKLSKNAENSTVFVSKSFQALAPSDECLPRKDRDDDHSAFEDASMSPTSGTSRLQSAITSISNVLSGAHENIKPRILEHSSHHSSLQNTGKRKKEHNGNYSNMQPPLKYTTLQTSSSSSSSSVYFGSGQSSKHAADRNHAEHFSNASHAEFFGADSNQGPDDEDDLHLDVTFVKEEYESQRNSVQRGVSVSAASRLSQGTICLYCPRDTYFLLSLLYILFLLFSEHLFSSFHCCGIYCFYYSHDTYFLLFIVVLYIVCIILMTFIFLFSLLQYI